MFLTNDDNLFKEYALIDLSRYKTKQIALRFRTADECRLSKGEAICANLSCKKKSINAWEVPFKYREDGEVKQELVKVKLCQKCERKLHYKSKRSRDDNDEDTRKKSKTLLEEDEDAGQRKHEQRTSREQTDEDESRKKVTSNEPENAWSKPIDPLSIKEKTIEEEMDSFLQEFL